MFVKVSPGRKKETSLITVFNIFRPLYITLTFPTITIVATMIDNNAFGFNTCNFGISSRLQEKKFCKMKHIIGDLNLNSTP